MLKKKLMSLTSRALPILASMALFSTAIVACSSSNGAPGPVLPGGSTEQCNAGCLCIDDESRCASSLGCEWRSGVCYNVGVPVDAGGDATTDDDAGD